MYLHPNRTYYRGSEQCKLRAPFLLLLQLRSDKGRHPKLHAVVRTVALRQFGHWMMGTAHLHGHWYVISGDYGSDGLPMTVDRIPKDAVPLPPDIADAYWAGDGWNSAGSEAPLLREWAINQFTRKPDPFLADEWEPTRWEGDGEYNAGPWVLRKTV